MGKFSFPLFALGLILLNGCRFPSYSFTSGTQPEAEAIAIPVFYNESTGGSSFLSQQFTEDLREYYQRNTKFDILNEIDPEQLQLTGAIVGFNISPVAPTNNNGFEVAALNRLTISVRVSYENPRNEEDNIDGKLFSFFADYPGDADFSTQEDALVEEITEQLILKIFTATFDNW